MGLQEKKMRTLVTGLWNIKREELSEGWSRTYQHYLDKFKELLAVDYNLIIFGDKELEDFVFKHREAKDTQFIVRDVDWFKNNDYYNLIQEIRNKEDWYSQSSWLKESTQARLEMYNPLVMSKVFLLNDAKLLDKFDSKELYWIDAGLTQTVHQGYFTHDKVLDNLDCNRFLFVAFPYEANNEIHGFSYPKINDFATADVKLVGRGGFFGGKKEYITKINNAYYTELLDTLNSGYMGTEESIFSILMYKYPDLINYAEIEGNGLLAHYFEELKNKTVEYKNTKYKDAKVGLYVITFNSPNQFETLINSIKEYDTDFLNKTKKYLLNNSTDLSTTPRYEELCKEYGFEHIKKDNIGITGGKQFVAEHFDKTNLDYYHFFEDDMFFYLGEDVTCKSGFPRKIKNLFEKSLKIIQENDYDFLKLNFTEFYGDNSKQWAWHNLPKDKKIEYFGELNDKPNTLYTHIKSKDGLAFAEGEIFLCNWPTLMSRKGNHISYLDTVFQYPAEQTIMSQSYQNLKAGKVKAAILLATPTEHNRFEFYDHKERKEN